MKTAGHAGAGGNSVHGALAKMDDSAALKSMMVGREGEAARGEKRNIDKVDEDDEPPDEVRLWEDGFKDRYYESKFDVGPGGEVLVLKLHQHWHHPTHFDHHVVCTS
jgi:5'-3' exoribonuclease 2